MKRHIIAADYRVSVVLEVRTNDHDDPMDPDNWISIVYEKEVDRNLWEVGELLDTIDE